MARNRPTRPGSSPTTTPAGAGGQTNHNNPNRNKKKKNPPLAPLPQTGILPSLGIGPGRWRNMKKKGRTQAQQTYQQFLTDQANTTPGNDPNGTTPGVPDPWDEALADAQKNQQWLEQNTLDVAAGQAAGMGAGVYRPGGTDDYTQWFANEYLPNQVAAWRGQHESGTQLPYVDVGQATGDQQVGDLLNPPDFVDPAAARAQYLRGTAARNSQPSQFSNPTGRWSWWD